MKENTEILSKIETDSLKKELHSNYLTSTILFLMVTFMIHIFSLLRYDKLFIPDHELFIMILVISIFYSLTIIVTRQLRSEIQQGQKVIERKIIEDKYDYIDKQDRFSSEFRKYVIVADSEKFIVTEDQFKRANINDSIVIHKTPLRYLRLKIDIDKSTSP